MLLQRIQADSFCGDGDLTVAELRPGFNAILLPDWKSADELTRRIFHAFAGTGSGDVETVFFVLDEMGEAIVTEDEIGSLLSDMDCSVFESLYNDGVRPDELASLVSDLNLGGLFVEESGNPPIDPTVWERLGFRNEFLQETLMSAKSQLDDSRNRLQHSNHRRYADLTKKQSETELTVSKLDEELSAISGAIAPLNLALELSPYWERQEKIKFRSIDRPDVKHLRAIVTQVESLDAEISKLRTEIAQLKRTRRQTADSNSRLESRLNRLRKVLNDSRRAEQIELDAEKLRDSIHEVQSSLVSDNESHDSLSPRTRRILIPFALDVRRARETVTAMRLAHAPDENTNSSPDSNLSAESTTEISELSEQIDFLRTACEQIRGRQSLPSGAFAGIIAVFLIGLGLNACGIIFDLGGNEWLTIGVGVLAMFSAGMLKISLERAPVSQLRIFRLEITAMLERISSLQLGSDTSFASVSSSADQLVIATEELDIAVHNWNQALKSNGLENSTSPEQLLCEVYRDEVDFNAMTASVDEWSDSRFRDRDSNWNDLLVAEDSKVTQTSASSGVESPDGELRERLQDMTSQLNRWHQSAAEELQLPVEIVGSESVAQITSRLRVSVTEVQTRYDDANRTEEANDDTEQQLQTQLKNLKRERRDCITKSGVETLVELKELIKTDRKQSTNKAKAAELAKKIEDALTGNPAGDESRTILETRDRKSIAAELSELHRTRAAKERELVDSQRRLGQIAQQIHGLAENREADKSRLECSEAATKIKIATHDLVSNLILQEALESRSGMTAPDQKAQSGVLSRASQFLRQTTPLENATIRFDESHETFFVEQTGQFPQPLGELDPETGLQVTLCIQLALFEYFQATGVRLPVLLSDNWTHPEREFAAETVRLLADIGDAGPLQFLLLTWDGTTADYYNDCEQPVLVVDLEEECVIREILDVDDEEFVVG